MCAIYSILLVIGVITMLIVTSRMNDDLDREVNSNEEVLRNREIKKRLG